jgi:acyl-CoA thioesterase-1
MKKFAMRFFSVVLLALLLPSGFAAEGRLPRVLVLGDSIYSHPSQQVARLLAGRAEVVFSGTKSWQVFNTTTARTHLDEVLGDGKWDVIHFNFGLADLVHRAPGMQSFRAMPKQAGGIRATSPEDYERNLIAIVTRLKATGAKLIWASTTPIRIDANGLYDIGSEVEYNAIAAKIMATRGIPTNDMHTAVGTLLDGSKERQDNPTYFGRISISPPLVEVICRELGFAPVPST